MAFLSRLIVAVGIALGTQALAQSAQDRMLPAREAEAIAEKLLAAMGGREAWAKVAGLKVEATHHQTDVAAPYANQIWNDFAEARVRFEARNETIHSVIRIEGGAGWRERDGSRAALAPERVAEETAWWRANVYRTLRRLAAKDPGLTPRVGEDGRLEMVEADGRLLNWFRLNQAGAPVQFGTGEGSDGTVFGPLSDGPDGIKYPRWGASQDGSFRYEVTALRVYTARPEIP